MLSSNCKHSWLNLRAPQLRDLAARDATVILPVGAVEQHGPHLPVQVDSLLATAVAEAAAENMHQSGRAVVVAPTVWTGLSEHHMPLGGTFTLDMSTYHGLLRCLVRSLTRHGFSRVLILNGHGGNATALSNISAELAAEFAPVDVLAMTYWTVDSSSEAMCALLEAQDGVLHAGEAESSMLLHLRPELVDDHARLTVQCPPDSSGLAPPGVSVAAAAGAAGRRFVRFTPTGVVGVPAVASATKGEALLHAAAKGVAMEAAAWIDDSIQFAKL